jgi:exopolysaccharide biosynthesis polyprenyl glycosylphosphotransferase
MTVPVEINHVTHAEPTLDSREQRTPSTLFPVNRDASALRAPASLLKVAWGLRFLDAFFIVTVIEICLFFRAGHWALADLLDLRIAGVWAVITSSLYLSDCYRFDGHLPRWHLPFRTVIVVLMAGILSGLGVYLAGPSMTVGGHSAVSRSVLVPAFPLIAVVLGGIRWLIQSHLRQDSRRSRWLVLGTAKSEALAHLHQAWQAQKSTGEICLLIDELSSDAPFPVTGDWNDLSTCLESSWTGVILTGGWEMPDPLIERLMHARLAGVRIYDLGEFYERFWQKLPVYHLHHGWLALTGGFSLLHDPLSARVKRLCDLVIAGSMLAIGFPFMVIIYLAIRVSSPGPGFFVQPRVGMGGQVFSCLKFRSMVMGSEVGSKYTSAGDRRITTLGRIMRKTRIDELPQLWNVLRGDMSFIGPRAEWTKCVADYEHVIPFYHLRHLVRPGLTGWAQVNYPYGVSVNDAREKLEYDLYYLKNHSLLLDLVILLRTVRVVVWGTGAR